MDYLNIKRNDDQQLCMSKEARKKRIEETFRRNGEIFDESPTRMRESFFRAVLKNNEGIMNVLTYPLSPVILLVDERTKDSSLHKLCNGHPNVFIAQRLIDCGININKQNIDGNTALHLSIINLNVMCHRKTHYAPLKLMKLLLKSGANRNITNNDNLTPIEECLFLGQLEAAEEFLSEKDKFLIAINFDRVSRCRNLIRCLVREKSNFNLIYTKYSMLLHFLILQNDDETFDYVVKNTQFSVNAVNHYGYTLLHLAVKQGTVQMVKMLISKGANVNVQGGMSFSTPLITAITNSRTEICHYLLHSGASLSEDSKNWTALTPLHYAVYVQNLEMVKTLVNMGANVNAHAYQCSTLLIACGSITCKKWYPMGSELFDHFFLNKGISRNAFTLKYKILHKLPFSIKIVEFLLDHRANIEAKNSLNRTSLDQACKLGQFDIVKLLLDRGAKINQGSVSTLHHAVKGGNPSVVRLILQQGADVNYRCDPEETLRLDFEYVKPPPRTPLECALHFTNDVDSSHFKPSLVTLIAFIAKEIENKKCLIEDNLLLSENDLAHQIYQDCMKELSLMKEDICESRNYSFYDILQGHIKHFGRISENEDAFKIFNSREYKKHFPIYGEYLEDQIQKTMIHQRITDLKMYLIQKHISRNILEEISLYISAFLNLDDVKILAKACFVDFEKYVY